MAEGREEGKKEPGTPGRMPENADRDAAVDAPAGGAGASTGKADPASQGRGLGAGGAPVPGIGERRTDVAAGPGSDGTVVPGNEPRPDRPDGTRA
jgi:hypothetical protein